MTEYVGRECKMIFNMIIPGHILRNQFKKVQKYSTQMFYPSAMFTTLYYLFPSLQRALSGDLFSFNKKVIKQIALKEPEFFYRGIYLLLVNDKTLYLLMEIILNKIFFIFLRTIDTYLYMIQILTINIKYKIRKEKIKARVPKHVVKRIIKFLIAIVQNLTVFSKFMLNIFYLIQLINLLH